MTWLGFGIFAGGMGFMAEGVENRQFFNSRPRKLSRYIENILNVVINFLYAAPVGGFVVVGQMILEFGVCVEIG